jgi:hypothetical protein
VRNAARCEARSEATSAAVNFKLMLKAATFVIAFVAKTSQKRSDGSTLLRSIVEIITTHINQIIHTSKHTG